MSYTHPSSATPVHPQANTAPSAVSDSCPSTPQNAYYPKYDMNEYQYGTGEPAYYYDPQTNAYYDARPVSTVRSWINFSDGSYLKGFLLGAGITLVATNPTIQKQVIKGAVKVWSLFQSGVEEVKEQFQDVKAEMTQE